MLKSHEGNNPNWRVKAINNAEMTKSKAETTLSNAIASKDLQEKAKCPWCAYQGHKAQRHNIRLKETEDTKEKNRNQITN